MIRGEEKAPPPFDPESPPRLRPLISYGAPFLVGGLAIAFLTVGVINTSRTTERASDAARALASVPAGAPTSAAWNFSGTLRAAPPGKLTSTTTRTVGLELRPLGQVVGGQRQ